MEKLFYKWLASYQGLSRGTWLLALVNLVNRFGGMVIGFIMLYMTKELHFSLTQTGFIMGVCFGGGALAGAYIGGRLVDRIGYFEIQYWSLIVNGLVLIAMLFVRDYYIMCVAVAAMSVSAEAFRPANQVAMSRHSSPETRTRSISLMRMSFNLGWTIAPAAGGLIKELFGWSALFWIDGLTCIAAALILRLLMKPLPRESAATSSVQGVTTTTSAPADVKPYRDRLFLAFVALTFLGALVFMQIVWSVPVFFSKAYQWTEGQIGLAVALNGLVVFLVEMPLIHQIEGKKPKLYYIRIGLILYALSYAGLMLPASLAVVIAIWYMVVISFGEIFVMPFSSNFVFERAEKQGNRGQYMAFYTMAYSTANIASPLLGTQIVDRWGYSALWSTLVAFSAITLVGFLWMQQKIESRRAYTGVHTA